MTPALGTRRTWMRKKSEYPEITDYSFRVLADASRPPASSRQDEYGSSGNTGTPHMRRKDTFEGPAHFYRARTPFRNQYRHIYPGQLFLRPYDSSFRSKSSPIPCIGHGNYILFLFIIIEISIIFKSLLLRGHHRNLFKSYMGRLT